MLYSLNDIQELQHSWDQLNVAMGQKKLNVKDIKVLNCCRITRDLVLMFKMVNSSLNIFILKQRFTVLVIADNWWQWLGYFTLITVFLMFILRNLKQWSL